MELPQTAHADGAQVRHFGLAEGLNPPAHATGHTSWQGMQLCGRAPGRRHGVCGIALKGELWQQIMPKAPGRWC